MRFYYLTIEEKIKKCLRLYLYTVLVDLTKKNTNRI